MTMRGFFDSKHDRQYTIHTPEFSGDIYEYNHELTGYDERFASLDPAFRYGGNAYYITGSLAHSRGWRVEEKEGNTA